MTDQHYFERRFAEELAAASASTDPRAAASHLALAQAYLLRLEWAARRRRGDWRQNRESKVDGHCRNAQIRGSAGLLS